MSEKKYEPPLGLEMPFLEALTRFGRTEIDEIPPEEKRLSKKQQEPRKGRRPKKPNSA